MNKNLKIILCALMAVTAGTAAQAGVAAKFEIVTGVKTGKGDLRGVPFTWTSTGSIEKTMDTLLRINNFSGNTVTFSFENPVDVEYVRFWSVNPSSANSITFYNAAGDVLPVAKTITSSADGVTGFTDTIENNVILFSACPGKDNYSAQIDLTPAMTGVSKIVIEIKKEVGLLDLRIGGTASR